MIPLVSLSKRYNMPRVLYYITYRLFTKESRIDIRIKKRSCLLHKITLESFNLNCLQELPVTPVSGQLPAMDRYRHNVQVSYRWFLGRVARSPVMMGMN